LHKEIDMAQVSKARVVIAPTGVVQVHVKPEVMFDLQASQELLKSVLGRLGCMACCSGYQIVFQHEAGEFTI
jgi:hypothetical protein